MLNSVILPRRLFGKAKVKKEEDALVTALTKRVRDEAQESARQVM